jgi:hypothetical protein
MITVYRILSFILLFFAFFLALGVLMMLGLAFSNPAILFTLFIVSAVVLYSFSSYQFLRKGISGGQSFKKSKKDFIKVNAYVALFFACINFIQSFTVILDPKLLSDMLKQVSTIQQQATGMSGDQLFAFIKMVLWIFLFYALALGAHIYFTFRFLKQYRGLFLDSHNDSRL